MRRELFNSVETDLPINFITCGQEKCIKDFCCAPHIRSFYLIHYVQEGCGILEVEGEKYQVFPNDCFVIYPNKLVTYYCTTPDTPWRFCWIGFDGRDAQAYLEAANISPQNLIITQKKKLFYDGVAEIFDHYSETRGNTSQIYINKCILKCLFGIESSSENWDSDSHSQRLYFFQAKNYIEKNYMYKISMSDLIGNFPINRTSMYRSFKKHFGLSPQQYIVKTRIEKSKELLKYSNYSITKISEFVGINDVFYFSKLFKKQVGQSPAEYRKKKRNTGV